jgi:hypothetical protein
VASRNTHLGRYRRIADVLSRHGLGYMVVVSGLDASCSNTRSSWDIHGGKSPTPVASTCDVISCSAFYLQISEK